MISVIIPALNEEKTIGQVVQLARKSPHVTEVIVVDDKSIDKTIEKARQAGAIVITSTKLGKAASLKDGVLYATNSIVTFLDADVTSYPENIVHLLTGPIIYNKADFTKSCYSRQASRVSERVAKPLLSILYPDFPSFWQPLSGMIAGKKDLFEKINFEEGYGVDIGILIDMHQMGARIEEISIGHIENKNQPLEDMAIASKQVAEVILRKSNTSLQNNLETLSHIQFIREQTQFAFTENPRSLRKIALFDLDDNLLSGSFIQTAAEKFNAEKTLAEILRTQSNPFIRTKQVAKLLKGKSISELLKIAEEIPVAENARKTIAMLRENGFLVGIISDGYDCITNHFKNLFSFDFSLANELEFGNNMATGEVRIPSFFLSHENSICQHDYCKTHALTHACAHFNLPVSDTIVIGSSQNDICMVKESGIGVSYCSSDRMLDSVADYVIREPDFSLVLKKFAV